MIDLLVPFTVCVGFIIVYNEIQRRKDQESHGISEREAKRTLEKEITEEIAEEAEFTRAERAAIQDEFDQLSKEVNLKERR